MLVVRQDLSFLFKHAFITDIVICAFCAMVLNAKNHFLAEPAQKIGTNLLQSMIRKLHLTSHIALFTNIKVRAFLICAMVSKSYYSISKKNPSHKRGLHQMKNKASSVVLLARTVPLDHWTEWIAPRRDLVPSESEIRSNPQVRYFSLPAAKYSPHASG